MLRRGLPAKLSQNLCLWLVQVASAISVEITEYHRVLPNESNASFVCGI